MANETQKIAIVTVHGTGDQAPAEPDAAKKWWEPGSVFAGWLTELLAAEGYTAEIHPLTWSGRNSSTDRESAARSLAKAIRQLSRNYAGIHVVGHSHGGNIADEAAAMLGWSGIKKRKSGRGLRSISTVGTPFFSTTLKAEERLAEYAFAGMGIISAILVAFLGAIVLTGPKSQMGQLSDVLVLLFVAINIVIIITIAAIASRSLARIRRIGRRRRRAGIFSIWHPEDEAIAFLRHVETLSLEPFPRGALWRGSGAGAIRWATLATLVLPFLGVLVLLSDFVLRYWFDRIIDLGPNNTLDLVGIEMGLVGAVGAPSIFAIVYLLYRGFALAVLEVIGRRPLNHLVDSALQGIAFGRDGGIRIGKIATRSHRFGTYPLPLRGQLADKMRIETSDAARRLFDKYRVSAFGTDADQSTAVREMASDALTWRALIHTTYFDHEEIAEAIAKRVSAAERKAAGLELETIPEPPARKPGADGVLRALSGVLRNLFAVAAAFGIVIIAAISAPEFVNRDNLASDRFYVAPPAPYLAFQRFRDCEICPEMVVLPGGTFVMGSPTSEPLRTSFEGPLRQVHVEPIAVGRFEVTISEYDAFIAATGYQQCADFMGNVCGPLIHLGSGGLGPTHTEGNKPVVYVSMKDARAYIDWLNERFGSNSRTKAYRLLTEIEWEYAARAGTRTRYSWGDEDPVCDRAAANGAQFSACDAPTVRVGTFQPNAFGLYDMHGNALEWVQDCWEWVGRSEPTGITMMKPGEATNPCLAQVLRGGAWTKDKELLRSASRVWGDPSLRRNYIGFRVARDL